jgi:hypothetical protein
MKKDLARWPGPCCGSEKRKRLRPSPSVGSRSRYAQPLATTAGIGNGDLVARPPVRFGDMVGRFNAYQRPPLCLASSSAFIDENHDPCRHGAAVISSSECLGTAGDPSAEPEGRQQPAYAAVVPLCRLSAGPGHLRQSCPGSRRPDRWIDDYRRRKYASASVREYAVCRSDVPAAARRESRNARGR